jgi:hypothetical protein
MQTATKAMARARNYEDVGYQFAGMLIVSLFPAMFWTLAIAGVGAAVGHAPSVTSLMVFGTSVAAFCATVFQVMTTQRS